MITNMTLRFAESGLPVCPRCGSILHWQSDWDAKDVGLDEEEAFSHDDVVGLYHCPDCDSDFYVSVDSSASKIVDASRF